MIPLRVLKGSLWGFKVYDLPLSIFSMTIHFYHCKVFEHIFESKWSILGTLKKKFLKNRKIRLFHHRFVLFSIQKNSKVFKKIRISNQFRAFNPFLSLPTLFFIFGKVKLIDSISGWSVTNLGLIHIKPEKAYGNETNWKIGFFLDLKSIIFQLKSFFS